MSYFFQCPFVHLARLLRFAFFQSLRMIFFRNMRLILRCLRRSIVNSVAANRCSTSGGAIRKCFFLFFWPLTGRCTRGTRIWRRLMVEVLEGCLYYNWLQNLKDTTIHYPSPISRPIPAQCHVAWLKLVDAGGQNPRMHMYNCYYGSCKWVFTSHCIYRFFVCLWYCKEVSISHVWMQMHTCSIGTHYRQLQRSSMSIIWVLSTPWVKDADRFPYP